MSNNLPTIRVRADHLSQGAVYAEIRERYGEREISDAAAVTIASWWQAPSNPALAALASGAPVTAAAITDDIARERRITLLSGIDALALDMLCTWAINFEATEDSRTLDGGLAAEKLRTMTCVDFGQPLTDVRTDALRAVAQSGTGRYAMHARVELERRGLVCRNCGSTTSELISYEPSYGGPVDGFVCLHPCEVSA